MLYLVVERQLSQFVSLCNIINVNYWRYWNGSNCIRLEIGLCKQWTNYGKQSPH